MNKRFNITCVGDEADNLVLRRNKTFLNKQAKIARKLNKDSKGPYKIIGKISPTTYKLSKIRGKSIGKWNIDDFKKEYPTLKKFKIVNSYDFCGKD